MIKPRFFSLFSFGAASLIAGALCLSRPVQAQTAAQIFARPLGAQCQSGTKTRLILHGVSFQPNSDRLTAAAGGLLDDAAGWVRSNPCASVYVETAADNASALSRARAQVIEARLMRDGVVPAHLVVAQVQAQPPPPAPSSLIMATQQSQLTPPRS
ncbi:MAG TPA: hypothetical protein VKV28_14980 [Candidatus Binataceae bacterium]|nr:hypothetical protein [Candidatus Binataceae bacterium]